MDWIEWNFAGKETCLPRSGRKKFLAIFFFLFARSDHWDTHPPALGILPGPKIFGTKSFVVFYQVLFLDWYAVLDGLQPDGYE